MSERIEVGVIIKGSDKAASDITKVSDSAKGLGSSIKGAEGMVGLLEDGLDRMTNGAYSGFKKATTAIKTFITGLKLTKTAIIATGIGALVVAVGLLVTYWDEISNLVNRVSEKLIKQETNLTRQISLQESELSLLKQKIQIEELRNGESILLTGEYKKQLLIQQEQNLQLLENLQIQLQSEKSKDKELSFWDTIKATAAGMLGSNYKALSIAESLSKSSEKYNEIQLKINESKKKGLDIDLQLAQIDSDARKKADEADANEQDAIATAKAKADAKIAAQIILEDELYALSQSAFERQELALQQEFDKRSAIAEGNAELLKLAEERLIFDLAALQQKADDDKAAAQKATDDRLAADKQIADDKIIAREEATAQAVKAARLGVVAAGFDALKSMAKTEEGQKKLAIAQILVNQGIALSSAIAGAQASALSTGPGAVFTAPGFTASMIGLVLGSFAQIKGIMNQAGASTAGLDTSMPSTGGGGLGGTTQLALTPSLDSFGKGVMNQAGASSGSIGTSSGGGVSSGMQLGLTPNIEGVTQVQQAIPPVKAFVVQSQLADESALVAQLKAMASL